MGKLEKNCFLDQMEFWLKYLNSPQEYCRSGITFFEYISGWQGFTKADAL